MWHLRHALPVAALLLVLYGMCAAEGVPTEPHFGWLLKSPCTSPEVEIPSTRILYQPQPGDIVLFARESKCQRCVYALAHTGRPFHASMVVALPDGRPSILEAGSFDFSHIYLADLAPRLHAHTGRVWVRRLRKPLTPEQSAQLTAFAVEQTDKRFALGRLCLEATPFGAHGPVSGCLFGSARIDRNSWFCSELVVAAAATVGLIDPQVMKPNTVFPRDLFYNNPFDLSPCWEEPRKWFWDP
jgi:hypothetical protein